jgi:hypothetical protein
MPSSSTGGAPSSSNNTTTSRRRSSSTGSGQPAQRRTSSNTFIGNAVNSALGNNHDAGFISSEEDMDLDIDIDDAVGAGGGRNSGLPQSDKSQDDDYHEESFSGPLHYVGG